MCEVVFKWEFLVLPMLDKIIAEAGDFKVAVYQHILPYLMQDLIVKFYQKIKKNCGQI